MSREGGIPCGEVYEVRAKKNLSVNPVTLVTVTTAPSPALLPTEPEAKAGGWYMWLHGSGCGLV